VAVTQGSTAVVLLPIVRQNAILVAAPKTRIEGITAQIKALDLKNAKQSAAVTIPLRNAPASRVAGLLTTFYQVRYGTDANQIHITWDDTTNSVVVQAAPGDLEEIRSLIARMDTEPGVVSDLRVVHLKYALSDTLATILTTAIGEGFTPTTAASQVAARGVGVGAAAAPGLTAAARATTVLPMTKAQILRFVSGKDSLVSGLLEDVRITSDARTNSLIVTAPEKTMPLLLQLIAAMDEPPAALASVHVFPLKRLDAATAASMLQQLFLGTTGTTGAPTAARPPGAPALPGAALGAATTTGTGQPLVVTLQVAATPEPGVTLVPVRVTVEPRTNSLVIAGNKNDLDVVEAVLEKLEASNVQRRRFEVYRLKNALAPDVANALTTFLAQELAYLQAASPFNVYEQLQQEVVITPEPIQNLLLISATPEYFEKVIRLVVEMDQLPPQVMIACLIADIDFNGTEEFGIEFGLQSPVLFQRSVIASGTPINTTTTNDLAIPGFNFNNISLPLGQASLTSPPVVGVQGLTNLGTGRTSPNTAGVGGFVFQASSDAFNLLIRALRTQNRLDVISRPSITTADNQQAVLLVGQSTPYITGSTTVPGVSGAAVVTIINTVAYRDTGVELQVTPKINPDGSVVMRVVPQVSEPVTSTTEITQGIFATAFNVQTVETTVIAQDGETVAIGGLINKTDNKTENKVPYLGDLPVIGALWRYRQELKTKKEFIVILTPHIIRNRADADRVLAEETRRMDWILGDVLKAHGTSGMEPVMPVPPRPPAGQAPTPILPPEMVPSLGLQPGAEPPVAGPLPAAAGPGPETLPSPHILPPGPGQGPVMNPPPPAPAAGVQQTSYFQAAAAPAAFQTAAQDVAASQATVPQEQESRRWHLFPLFRHDD
jgi:type II secretion system protein D